MKPTAELTITRTSPQNDAYRLYVDGRMVWITRAYPTQAGRDGARERLRAWLRIHPYHVVMAPDRKAVA